jgi:hypothetical protein
MYAKWVGKKKPSIIGWCEVAEIQFKIEKGGLKNKYYLKLQDGRGLFADENDIEMVDENEITFIDNTGECVK